MTPGLVDRLNSALSGRYRIERELGEGGMATVYLAADLRHERQVALKVLKPELAAVVGAERFLGEIRTTANLQHPNILPLFDSGEADGFLFYVMPYVEGESLRDRLQRDHQLPVDEAVRIAADVAEALQAAHEQGVVHRDVKPANILLSRGRALVADFGIALAVSTAGSGRLTETGLSMGTPFYMSPEQASADRDPAATSDVYSLGCVLHEMLVGEPPYTGSSAQAVLTRILVGEPPAPRAARPTIPAHVDAVIRRAVERLPADRFASAAEMARSLADPGFRHGPEVDERATPHAARRPRIAAAAMLVAGLVLGATLMDVFGGAGDSRGDRAVRLSATAPTGFRIAMEGINPIAIAPDGSRVVFVGADSDGTALFARPLDRRSVERIAGTAGATLPFFSPDGASLGFVLDGRLQRMPVEGGTPLTIVDLSTGLAVGASWGPDDMIVYAEPAMGLAMVPASGGTPTVLTVVDGPGGEFDHTFPQITPDGETVLFTIRAGDGSTTAALSLRTGQWRSFREGSTAVRYLATGHLLYPEGGALVALPFDLDALEPTGAAVPVVDSVVTRTARAVDVAYLDVSPAGDVAYIHGRYTESLAWLSPAGTVEPWGTRERGYWYFRLSPDDRLVAATIPAPDTQDEDLWILDTGPSGRRTKLTDPGDNITSIWTPNGTRVTYSSNRGGDLDLYWQEPDVGDDPEPLLEREHSQYLGSWSPDASVLAYGEEHPTTGRDIWLLPVDPPGDPIPLLNTAAQEDQAIFSPDGRWLAYSSDETGTAEVYVMAMPPSGRRQAITTGGGREPQWSHEGDRLFFRRGSRVLAVELSDEGGELIPEGAPREVPMDAVAGWYNTWFQGFDVAADGRMLVIHADVFTTVDVVLGWASELRATAAGR